MSTVRDPNYESAFALPHGTPAWITPELVLHTLKIWQPHYTDRLTVVDAVTILTDVGRLFSVLSRG